MSDTTDPKPYDPTWVPKWARRHKTAEKTLFYKGTLYTVHLLSPDLEPRLPYFVGFPDVKFLFASDNIPDEFMIHVVAQEVREFVEFSNELGRCWKSVKIELDSIQDEDFKNRYIAFLVPFFQHMVTYYEPQTEDAYINGLKVELADTLSRLQQIATPPSP